MRRLKRVRNGFGLNNCLGLASRPPYPAYLSLKIRNVTRFTFHVSREGEGELVRYDAYIGRREGWDDVGRTSEFVGADI
jgi:hypothetical protein